MPRRNAKSNRDNDVTKLKPKAIQQLVVMVISIVLMVFSVIQVYHLSRYTLGLDVKQKDMKVYRWVYMLLEHNATKE